MADFSFILERLSGKAKNSLIAAQMVSESLHADHIGTEHLLFGILSEKNAFASEILTRAGLTIEKLKPELEAVSVGRQTANWKPALSENLKEAIGRAAGGASQFGYQFIGTEHFLFGLLAAPKNAAKTILQRLGIQVADLERNLVGIFESTGRFAERPDGQPVMAGAAGPAQEHRSALEFFTVDLTKLAKEGKIDPVIGRAHEISRITAILARRLKNNAVLIGEAGVGKTAIVEGLALAIANKEVPDILLDKRILSLDLALVVAGAIFRGEFENRLKQIIEEAKHNPRVILFIDELHTLVGAGSAQGSMDAANILKPALARGELRVIGATTLAEYKKYIEHDQALERRFQSILVEEPTGAQTLDILKGLRPNYEKHHRVSITDEALQAAVELSTRYIQDHFLPDKAVDVIDETAAFFRSLQANSPTLKQKMQLEQDLAALEEEKNKSVWGGDFATAEHLKAQAETLLLRLADLNKQLGEENKKPIRSIDASDIAGTVAKMTKIPLEKLTAKDTDQLLGLEEELKSKIIGQDEAVAAVAKAVRRARAGLHDPSRPLASFIFLGPTGVGKTETARVLARQVFSDDKALIRVDMSEFMERHNVSRLVGAPAGYVGFEEGGHLTEAVRRRPYSVVLFDELEKAHPDVFNILLQILEDGILTDGQGKTVSFRNTIIIMTSNLGTDELAKEGLRIGFGSSNSEQDKAESISEHKRQQQTEHIMTEIKRTFRPEFVNRIDKILIFHALGLKELQKIAGLALREVALRLAGKGLSIRLPAALTKFIAEKSFDPLQGARFVRKNIEIFVEDPLAEMFIKGELVAGDVIVPMLTDAGVSFQKERSRLRQLLPV